MFRLKTINHHQAELQEFKRGLFYWCMSGLRSQPLQATVNA